MNRMERDADKSAASSQKQEKHAREDFLIEDDRALDDEDPGQELEADEREPRSPLLTPEALREPAGEQAEFREQFDEDLYTDREDRPAQGNTADVAMGEQRFGSEAEAYTEYAYRRPGDHHQGDGSAVGQARDPADIAADDDQR